MKALARCTSDPGRYKIIEEKDLNGKVHYELWFHKPTWWFNDRWEILETTTTMGNVIPFWFDTEKDVYDYLRSLVKTRTVVKEGRINS